MFHVLQGPDSFKVFVSDVKVALYFVGAALCTSVEGAASTVQLSVIWIAWCYLPPPVGSWRERDDTGAALDGSETPTLNRGLF